MNRGRISFSNAHMFDRVMLDESICRMFLERVLSIQVERIDYKNAEQVLEPKVDTHGVRLDLFVKTPEGVFDIEMEAEPRGSIGRRLRYYQAAIDTTILDVGEPYWMLPKSFVIFLCKHDPFGRGLPVYSVQMRCEEDDSVEVGCAIRWVVLNSAAYDDVSSEGLRNLLEYVQNGTSNRDDELVTAIDEAVDKANNDRKWVDMVFSVSTIEEDIRREGQYRLEMAMKAAEERAKAAEEEGRQRGLQQGLQQGIEQGMQQGIEQGEELLAALTQKLIADNRIEELKAQTEDLELRKALYQEYGLA